jgi:hypothetical protein
MCLGVTNTTPALPLAPIRKMVWGFTFDGFGYTATARAFSLPQRTKSFTLKEAYELGLSRNANKGNPRDRSKLRRVPAQSYSVDPLLSLSLPLSLSPHTSFAPSFPPRLLLSLSTPLFPHSDFLMCWWSLTLASLSCHCYLHLILFPDTPQKVRS